MADPTKLKPLLSKNTAFTAGEYISISRQITNSKELKLKPLKLGFLTSFTINLIEAKLVVEGAVKGMHLQNYYAPFNQFEQELMTPDSGLNQFQPDIIIMAFGSDDLQILQRFLLADNKQKNAAILSMTERINQLVSLIRKKINTPILLWNFPKRLHPAAGLSNRQSTQSETSFFEQLNQSISKIGEKNDDVYIFDIESISTEIGLRSFYDPRLQFLARMPFSASAQIAISRTLARYLAVLKTPPKKCLVLDLDNTLWGGVIGEDGLSGIQLGQDYPGSAYLHFHRYILSLKDRGILLAIASKNNREDAVKVLEQHPDCLVSISDFSDTQINWNDKANNLQKIASNLNIGTDSLVFFDDNPIEREWVKSQIPEVCVLDFPDSPVSLPDFIEDSGIFDRLVLTKEDQQRSRFYQVEKERRALKHETNNIEDFLRNLQTIIQVEVLSPDSSSFARAVQLMAKTNQFNLTTRRHGETELKKLLQNGSLAISIRVSDKFGEHGMVGLALAKTTKDSNWTIDTFLLSCRVMGREIETALLSVLIDQISTNNPGKKVLGEYIATHKNTPVKNFYPNQGFHQIDDSEIMRYEFDPKTQAIKLPDIYTIEFI